MEDELRELQEYSRQVEDKRIEARKNRTSITPESVQSMDVSTYFDSDLKNATDLVEQAIKQQTKDTNSLGIDVVPKIEEKVSEKVK